MKKQLLSFCVLFAFIFLAVASEVNKIHYGAFNYSNSVEDPSEKGNYLEKNNGEKVYGDKISWKAGLFVKDQMKIDGQKFAWSEIKGFRDGKTYYAKHNGDFIKRIVHGKINVYVQFTEVTQTSTDRSGFTHTHTYTRTDQYAQKDDGPMIPIGGQKDIINLVRDCPLAVQMADISNSKMRKAIKKDRNYLNSIFDVYNNGCKAKP